VGGAVLTTLLLLLCHSCWGQHQPTHLEICLLFSNFIGFTALGTLTILSDKGTFDDPIERRAKLSMIAMDQFLDINIKPNKDGMMLALGIVGALSSFLFLTDMFYALSRLTSQKSSQYPVPRK